MLELDRHDADLQALAIDEELRLLARQNDGFENPKALAAKLNLLLDLSCVKEAAISNRNSSAARVIGLQQVLSTVIGRISDEGMRRAATIYFFLEDPAELRFMKERRAAIESALHMRKDEYRFGQEQRMRGVVAAELLRFEMETRGGALLPVPSDAEEPLPPDQSALRVIVNALSRHYLNREDLSPLGSLIIPDRPVYYDVMVEMQFHDDPSSTDHLLYDSTVTFTAELNEYVMGIVDKPGLCDVLLGECQHITDIFSCSDKASRQRKAQELARSADTVSLTERTTAGKTRLRPVPLEPIKQKDYGRYLEHLADGHRNDVSLLQGRLPDTALPLPRLTVSQRLHLDKADHFCYWVADRPMYIRRFDIDLSRFTPSISGRDGIVTVQPFMMAGATQATLDKNPHISLAIENWLVRGQGIAVIW